MPYVSARDKPLNRGFSTTEKAESLPRIRGQCPRVLAFNLLGKITVRSGHYILISFPRLLGVAPQPELTSQIVAYL